MTTSHNITRRAAMGAIAGTMGVLAALFRREKSGRGCLVELNLLNSALDLQM